jgi:hypothetical protein
MPPRHHRFLPTDIIRTALPTRRIRDGMRVEDVPTGLLLIHLRSGRMTLERNGYPLKIHFLPPRPRGPDGKQVRAPREGDVNEVDEDRPPPRRRPCLCCSAQVFSTGPHHRLGDTCWRQNEW